MNEALENLNRALRHGQFPDAPAPYQTPLGAFARGLAAGVAGTATMTAWQTAAAKLLSSDEDGDQSAQAAAKPWKTASAPAQVARRILKGVFRRDPPPERIPLLTNVMHWSYGIGWGAAYGLIAGTTRRSTVIDGLAFGAGVWAASYAELVPMGIYQPPWKYKPQELALDLSYHLAYGSGVALAFGFMSRD